MLGAHLFDGLGVLSLDRLEELLLALRREQPRLLRRRRRDLLGGSSRATAS
jgi:hypothetical protein